MVVRVTLVATTASAVVMALLLSGLFVAVTGQLAARTEAGLRVRAAHLQASLAAGDVGELAAEPYAQLGQGAQGRLSPALRGAPLVPAGVAVRGERLLDHDAPRPGAEDERLRVLARRLPDGRLLAVGVPRATQEEVGERLLAGLALAGPLLLLLVAAVVARSVQAALRPVGQLTREARQISAAEDTGRRLAPVAGDDEIAELSRTLDAMLARLAVAFEHERAFVDDASHELRTPLAVLRGELELALSDPTDRDAVEQSLRAALDEAERLTRLADDLLLLARERAGALQLRADDLDLRRLLDRTAARLGPATGLALTVDCPPLRLAGDADRLEQVLTNLVVNACAAGAGRAVLAAAREGDRVRLSVEDDGPGFPPGFAEVAFGRFTRADAARTRTAGAGLGLALVAAVVHAAGGTVRAGDGSRLGGAAVRLELPA
jgi:two-component system, OmpR family, sensor kinase